jgi:rhodanese-related sulfurtransferase
MKKLVLLILIVFITISMAACQEDNANSTDGTTDEGEKNPASIVYSNMTDIKEIMESNEDYIIVDVRTIEEYREGHIPGAINIPNETITNQQPPELPDKEQLILIYCRSGNRSKQAAQKLLDMGYVNLVEFGGIIDWDGNIVTGDLPHKLLELRMPMPDIIKIQLPKLLGGKK